jgi:putative restriction endonuclease
MSTPIKTPPEAAAPLTVPPEVVPDLSKFVIEDGKPVDGILSEMEMRLLTEPLKSNWSAPEGQPFVVMANVGVFYADREPPVVPDVLLAVGVRQGTDLTERENLSYFAWTRGKAPDIAIEIVSNQEGGEDSYKLRTYARVGVPYYVIFDPDDLLRAGVLRAFELRGRRYRPLAEPYFLEDAGLGVRLWDGVFEGINRTWLRWCDREGNVIPTGAERAETERRRADEETQRADEEKKRANEEKKRANRAEKELARLRDMLRDKGIDPSE